MTISIPTKAEATWLSRADGAGKLPLFDEWGVRIDNAVMQHCIDMGWAETWFLNPVKNDWQVCRITDAGKNVLSARPAANDA